MAEIKNDLSVKYSLAIRTVHWLTAIGIFIIIPIGLKISEMEISADKLSLQKTHNIIGLALLILTLFRIFLYFKHERPANLKTGSKWNDKLVIFIHNSFYFVIIIMAISGLVTNATTGVWEAVQANDVSLYPAIIENVPAQVHKFLYLVLAVLILMHIGGVLKHWILKKENTLKRII